MSETITRTRDEENPEYIFQTLNYKLIAKIASGELDAVALAKKELRNRGLDYNGKWVGFDEPSKNKYWSFNLERFVTIPED